jgi:transposase
MSGRPKVELVLSDVEREKLIALTLRRKTSQALAPRSRIVLACAEGQDNNVVAERLRITPQMVSKWRGRFVRDRLDGLLEAPRPNTPPMIEDAQADAVMARTLQSVLADVSH